MELNLLSLFSTAPAAERPSGAAAAVPTEPRDVVAALIAGRPVTVDSAPSVPAGSAPPIPVNSKPPLPGDSGSPLQADSAPALQVQTEPVASIETDTMASWDAAVATLVEAEPIASVDAEPIVSEYTEPIPTVVEAEPITWAPPELCVPAAATHVETASETVRSETFSDEVSTALALIAESDEEPEREQVLPQAESEQRSSLALTTQEILDRHQVWLHSGGHGGERAELSRADLTGQDLTDANLRGAALNRAILKDSDMLLTDLQGASLLQADLRGANLLGAKLQDANLQGAMLQGATGLQSAQLAGGNLFGAALPADVSVSASLRQLQKRARFSSWAISAICAACALAWLRILTTSDVQLLVNGPVIPLAGMRNLLPLVPFYLCGPVALLGFYIFLQLSLQRLWDATAAQPAIFPDGRRLDTALPWFARWSARGHRRWLREQLPTLASLEAGVAMTFLYWLVPVTLLGFWARYLTMQDVRGTLLHVLMIVAASSAAVYFTRAAGRAYQTESLRGPRGALARWAFAPTMGLALALLSFGAIWGAPHASSDRGAVASGAEAWASDLLWWAGYTPTAQLNEAEVSVKPSAESSTDDLKRVSGARMNGLRLRYVQAYGAYFAKAHLWQADLSHANLSETDLREANLRQASLESAAIDKAQLARAVLQEADLRHANLTQSDLQDANLSRARLSDASLRDAKLDGANLYGSDLRNAVLLRASLQHADLRDAVLENADLSMAILRQTYLSSAKMSGAKLRGAQLAQAFLTQADLRQADLSGAGLQGAILNGANLSGANLDRVDLRGALGITASQVCSAGSAREIQMDDMLQHEVQALCGSKF